MCAGLLLLMLGRCVERPVSRLSCLLVVATLQSVDVCCWGDDDGRPLDTLGGMIIVDGFPHGCGW